MEKGRIAALAFAVSIFGGSATAREPSERGPFHGRWIVTARLMLSTCRGQHAGTERVLELDLNQPNIQEPVAGVEHYGPQKVLVMESFTIGPHRPLAGSTASVRTEEMGTLAKMPISLLGKNGQIAMTLTISGKDQFKGQRIVTNTGNVIKPKLLDSEKPCAMIFDLTAKRTGASPQEFTRYEGWDDQE